jgi:dTDP-4-amino-4,6-dideoxygalactose transaminase
MGFGFSECFLEATGYHTVKTILPRQRIPFPGGAATALSRVPFRTWNGTHHQDVIREFEENAARFLGVGYAVALSSGRQALAAILAAMELPRGSAIGVPAFTFHAVPFALRDLGYHPVFLDVDRASFNVGVRELEQGLREAPDMRAVIVTHAFGVPAQVRELAGFCLHRGVYLVGDAAHLFCRGADAVPGETAAFHSLETSKPLSAMGGGLAVTNDPILAGSIRAATRPCPESALSVTRALVRQTAQATATSAPVFRTLLYPLSRALSLLGRDLENRQVDVNASVLEGPPTSLHPFRAALALEGLSGLDRKNDRRRALAGLLAGALGPKVRHQEFGDPAPPLLYFTLLHQSRDRMAGSLLRLGIDTKRDFLCDCAALAGGLSRPVSAQLAREALHLPIFPSMSDSMALDMADAVNRSW